jgi:four helix bundle protein
LDYNFSDFESYGGFAESGAEASANRQKSESAICASLLFGRVISQKTGDHFFASRSRGDHRDLDVWKLAIELAKEVYRLTACFPPDERFGLVSQMRRASVSISANIAEGYGRGSAGDFARFLKIARGSAREVEALVELSAELQLVSAIDAGKASGLTTRILMMLTRLVQSVERRN